MRFSCCSAFLNEGLRALDKRTHSLLCFVLLLFYSLFPYSFLNGLIRLDMSYSVWLFIYEYVLITCIRWHYSEFLLNRRLGNQLLALGLALGIGTQVLFGLPLLIMGKSMSLASVCSATGKPRGPGAAACASFLYPHQHLNFSKKA